MTLTLTCWGQLYERRIVYSDLTGYIVIFYLVLKILLNAIKLSSSFNFKMLNTRFEHSSKSTTLGRLKKSLSGGLLYPPFVQPAPEL